jgi:hypothetical protein
MVWKLPSKQDSRSARGAAGLGFAEADTASYAFFNSIQLFEPLYCENV